MLGGYTVNGVTETVLGGYTALVLDDSSGCMDLNLKVKTLRR